MIIFLLIIIILLLVYVINPIWIEVIFAFGLILAILALFVVAIYFAFQYEEGQAGLLVIGIFAIYHTIKHFVKKYKNKNLKTKRQK